MSVPGDTLESGTLLSCSVSRADAVPGGEKGQLIREIRASSTDPLGTVPAVPDGQTDGDEAAPVPPLHLQPATKSDASGSKEK